MSAYSAESFDLVVVGAGMVGSAAARHAAEAGRKVALVGPGEPTQEAARVYGCHADEGRICRRLDVDPVWAVLAARSMDRYADVEARSGVRFHDACGCLAVGRAGGPYLEGVAATAKGRGLELEALDEAALKTRFPRLRLDATLLGDAGAGAGDAGADPFNDDASRPAYAGLYEPASTGAGTVSARRLVAAQHALFEKAGGVRVDGVAAACEDEAGGVVVKLEGGGCVRGARALVCANASTNFRPLLPRRLKIELTTQTVRRRALAPEVQAACPNLPAIIVRGGASAFGAPTAAFDSVYIVPPRDYGDGAPAYKVGHGSHFERSLADEAAFRAWYEERDVEERVDSFARCELLGVARRLFRPSFVSPAEPTDRCVIPKTPTHRPYVHKFSDALGCCAGCNGYAAKSSDELGRLAQEMMFSPGAPDFGPEIPADSFLPVFDEEG
mmetsp:Transcript_5860/g.18349  ORF Transcript_5860/g.18349 Transcript_5860/m.18349 type:complete len:443 (+) Transcript_5860:1201-2529(+)